MLNKTKELIDNGKDIKSACKEVLLNTPNVERYRAYYFQLVDDVFPELKASLDQKYFKNFKHGNKFMWEFITDTYHTCKMCGKIIPSVHEYCSKDCMESDREVINKRVKETLFKNFGEAGLRSKSILEKKKKTNLAKYGCEYVSQNEEVKRKALETNKRNHGGILAMQNPLIKAKIVETNLQKYGVRCASQAQEIKDKIRQTNMDRYGYVCNFADPQKRAEYEQICIEKHGENYKQLSMEKAKKNFL